MVITFRVAGLVLFLFMAAFLSPGLCLAESAPGSGGGQWATGSRYNSRYDSRFVETVKGEVTSVGTFAPDGDGSSPGVLLTLKVGRKTVTAHLGPGWFMAGQEVRIEKGDEVELTGSRIRYEGRPVVLVSVVKKGRAELRLRGPDGAPAWPPAGR